MILIKRYDQSGLRDKFNPLHMVPKKSPLVNEILVEITG